MHFDIDKVHSPTNTLFIELDKVVKFTLKIKVKVIFNVNFKTLSSSMGDRGGSVVKVLCYKPEGRWVDPSWCRWNFSLT